MPAQQIAFTFSEDVSAALSITYFILTNVDTSEQVPFANMALAYDTGTNTATVTFPGYPNGALPDGNYHATLAAGYTDLFGNAATSPLDFDFFVFAGDANHDRAIDIGDFAALAANFNAGSTVSTGDFDYSGLTDIGDFAILASKFNQTLPAPAARPGGAPASRSTFSSQLIAAIDPDDWLELTV